MAVCDRGGCLRGFTAHVGDPAEIAARHGRKKRAKTDRADAQLQREWKRAGSDLRELHQMGDQVA